MNKPVQHFNDLFAQLGLPCDDAGIRAFLAAHSPLAAGVGLPEAPFWTPAQKAFLRESVAQDAEWAVLVDQLSAALRGPEGTK